MSLKLIFRGYICSMERVHWFPTSALTHFEADSGTGLLVQQHVATIREFVSNL